MHSRIFQVSTKPIPETEYFSEARYYDGFVGNIADYVDGDTDKEEDLRWLQESLGEAAAVDIKKGTIRIVDRIKYFEKKYPEFIKEMQDATNMTLEEFASYERDLQIFCLRSLYDDAYSFYLDSEECGMQTVDSFMRTTENGEVWYVGKVFDYHV